MIKQLKILFVLLAFAFLTSCVGKNDWCYELKNGYEINHINSNTIVCDKKESEHSSKIIIGEYVTKFSYDDTFVYLQYLGKYTDDFDQLDEDCFKYATINFDTGEIDCSETFNEFADKISDENILNLDKWNATKPSPSGAEFPK